jgi:hydroxymethylpyrimidine pyrophosphatase-like HAD family hydrolase
MSVPKTVFCDIDGTLVPHTGDTIKNLSNWSNPLPGVIEAIRNWDRSNYRIILTTGRKESTRAATEKQLNLYGIVYDDLLMGLPNGDRVIINDRKNKGAINTAYAINLVRNQGLENIDLASKNITIPDQFLFTKNITPFGYEELLECNDKYAVKKIFMNKDTKSSIQYHELKRKTITVLSGLLHIYIGTSLEDLKNKIYKSEETITIDPYTIHRLIAMEDCLYMEISTNELWDLVNVDGALTSK